MRINAVVQMAPQEPALRAAFASGEHHNDISGQMRNIARAMTPQEIEDAAACYASQPPEIAKTTDRAVAPHGPASRLNIVAGATR